MNYELAKQLKEAGFPQSRDGVEFISIKGQMEYFIPTLSELIEACGDSFEELTKIENNWVVTGGYQEGKGSTPEEAVANLWLELNK